MEKHYSEAMAKITHLRQVHKKDSMDYIKNKHLLTKELEWVKKSGSEKVWTLTTKVSFLKAELRDSKEKIRQLESSSAWGQSQVELDWDWSKKLSNLQVQLNNAEQLYNFHQIGWHEEIEGSK